MMRNIKNEVLIERLVRSGPGGQHRNRKATGIRLTHLPTGLTVLSTKERSQAQNLRLAFMLLQKKIEKKFQKRKKRIASTPGKKAHEKRLTSKTHHSQTKKLRSKVKLDD